MVLLGLLLLLERSKKDQHNTVNLQLHQDGSGAIQVKDDEERIVKEWDFETENELKNILAPYFIGDRLPIQAEIERGLALVPLARQCLGENE